MAKSSSSDVRDTIEQFLVAVYERARASEYTAGVPIALVTADVAVPARLAEKLAHFLESAGLVDYDNQLVDITVDGILKAEEALRARATRPSRRVRR